MKILSIDPGVTACGLAILEDQSDSDIVTLIDSHTVIGSRKLREEHAKIGNLLGERVGKIARIETETKALLSSYPDIDTIVVEEPFMHTGRPMAYRALVEVLTMIKFAIAIPNGMNYYGWSPKFVKKYFSDFGASEKDGMRNAITERRDNKEIIVDNIDELTEHEIDAFAIGYSFFKLKKEGLLEESMITKAQKKRMKKKEK